MIKDLSKQLNTDDIELRIGTLKEGAGFSLLAYKTARTDVKRLNDVCGEEWQNKYYYDDKGYLCCSISIWSEKIKQWINRTDVGVDSNTEKEKGSYSDAMKRAGFKWGIGIELYKFPFIWINWKSWKGKYPSCSYDIRNWKVIYPEGTYDKGIEIVSEKGDVIWSNTGRKSERQMLLEDLKKIVSGWNTQQKKDLQKQYSFYNLDELTTEQIKTILKVLEA